MGKFVTRGNIDKMTREEAEAAANQELQQKIAGRGQPPADEESVESRFEMPAWARESGGEGLLARIARQRQAGAPPAPRARPAKRAAAPRKAAAPKAAKGTKAANATKTTRVAKATKVTKATRAAKATQATKATRTTRTTRTTKAAKRRTPRGG